MIPLQVGLAVAASVAFRQEWHVEEERPIGSRPGRRPPRWPESSGRPPGALRRLIPAFSLDLPNPAAVAELVYAMDSKSIARKGMWVRFPPAA